MANLSFIKKALPWLGTAATLAASAVPGAAPIVGIATKLLSAGLNKSVSSGNITDILTEALGDPAQLAALKQSEQAYQQAMQQMGFQHETDMEAIAEKDRESARAMQVQTKSWIPGALAVGVTLGFFSLLAMMMLHAVPPNSENILDVMTGSLGAAWLSIVNYYFGSSSGSAAKTEILAKNGK